MSGARHGGRGKGAGGKAPSRAQVRERQLREAEAVTVADGYDVVVAGGGAAGLVAAITAAEAGASALVLEASPECGRTILATGNGRCNFCNVGLAPKYYNDPDFVGAVMGETPLDDILGFFRACGMRWCLEGERLYPLSRRAASVRNVLLRRARAAGVTLAPAREVASVGRTTDNGTPDGNPCFSVGYLEGFAQQRRHRVLAGSLVLAAGGTGAQGDAAGLAADLGLGVAPAEPVLCPVACETNPLLGLDGRRATARVQLTRTRFPLWSERGEVLVRDYGLSGIVVFDMSRRTEPGDLVELDLAPDVTRSELRQMVDPMAHGSFEAGCLDGILDPDVASLLERLARERWTLPGLGREAPSDSEALMDLVKAYPLRVTGTTGHAQAQVMRGGLLTRQFDASTLECTSVPKLFAAGEALDVDADCGGFNLSWAWKSGMVAGAAAARTALADPSASQE